MMESRSIFEYFDSACEDKSCVKLEYYGKKFTVAEVLTNSLKVGGFLIEQGYQGHSVGVMLPNIPEAIFTLYGCSAVGSIANLINPRLPTARLRRILSETNTKIIFMYDALYARHHKMLEELGVKVILCSPFYYRAILRPLYFFNSFGKSNYFSEVLKSKPCTPISTDGTETVVYVHSGGTTGEPKTVKISSYALNCLARAILDTIHPNVDYSRTDDCMLMMLPIFHGFGLGVCVHTIACAFRIALEPRFTPNEAVKLIKKHRVTHLAGVPAMYRKMLTVKALADGRLQRITDAFAGGDTLDVNLKNAFDEVLKKSGSNAEVVEGYGLSETASVVTVGRKGHTKYLSQGEPLIGNEVKIIANGSEAPAGTVGEICVKTSSLMSGYLDGSADGITVYDGEKWLHTGDLGYIDEDGSLFYKERLKRSIKIGAVNIFPSEIEKVVGEIEGIKACCAARAYDKNNKPYVRLYVELTAGKSLSSGMINKIKRKTELEIVRYAVPKEIRQVDEIKRTDIGKIDFAYYEIKIN